MSLKEKRKHKTLTIIEKTEIIKKIDNGEKLRELASFYGVGRATIYDIKNNRDKIERYAKNLDSGSDRKIVISNDKLARPWDREKILILVKLFHAEPCLWDINSSEYGDKIKKALAVRSISDQLKCSEDEIIKKIKSLKIQFRREKKKIESGITDEKVWFAYNHLTFLPEKNSQTTQLNIEDNSSNTLIEIKEERIFCQTPSPDHSMHSSFDLPAEQTSNELPPAQSSYDLPEVKSPFDLSEESEEHVYKFMGDQTLYEHREEQRVQKTFIRPKEKTDDFSDTSEVDNQFDYFGKYIAAQLKSLSDEQAVLAQDEIQGIITKRKLIDIKNK